MYSGPVAACVCAGEPAASMPCCPDDAEPSGHANCSPQSDVDVACDPLTADALLPSLPDLRHPAALPNELAPWLTSDPPSLTQRAKPPSFDTAPIYLVTLRLRI